MQQNNTANMRTPAQQAFSHCRRGTPLLSACALFLLSACGGGNDASPREGADAPMPAQAAAPLPPPAPPPDPAPGPLAVPVLVPAPAPAPAAPPAAAVGAVSGGREAPFPYVAQCPSNPTLGAVRYYVSPLGNDSNGGTTLASAFRNITKGLGMARPGDVVYVAGGIYREQVDLYAGGGLPGNKVTLRNLSGASPVLTGSDVMNPSGWTLLHGAIYAHSWNSISQQVFVDGVPLQQIGPTGHGHSLSQYTAVGSGLPDLDSHPGAFWHDKNTSLLYVRLSDNSAPASHLLEASTRIRTLFLDRTRAPNVCIEGLSFRHSNQTAHSEQGAGVLISNGSVLANSLVEYMDFAGVELGGDASRVAYSVIRKNGALGVTSSNVKGVGLDHSQVLDNNYRGFNADWAAGGVKLTTHTSGAVGDNEVARNKGPAIWFDTCQNGGPIAVTSNYVHDNGPGESAIFIEASNAALVANNLLVDNARRAVYLSASNGSRIYMNTVVRTSGRAALELGGVPRNDGYGALTLSNNDVRGNIVALTFAASNDPVPVYDLVISRDSGASNNHSDENLFFRRASAYSFSSTSEFATLDAWRSGTSWDLQSQSADPKFFDEARGDFTLALGSPARRKVSPLAAVPADHDANIRFAGAQNDQGAFESK